MDFSIKERKKDIRKMFLMSGGRDANSEGMIYTFA